MMSSSFFLAIAAAALILSCVNQAHAVPYDYTYTAECLPKPLEPQYTGGVVVNPELNQGLRGWTAFGDSKVKTAESEDGNKFIVSSSRNSSFHSFSQTFDLDKDKLYTFSGWFQVSHGNAEIAAIFKTNTSYVTAGWVSARNSCWSMLKGGLVVNTSGPAHLYFESNNTAVDIWADSISLQPFSQDEWKSHQDLNIEKVRKTRVRLQAVDHIGKPIANATVSLKQRRSAFPFGCAINQNILRNPAYQNWFLSRFRYTVFENELKWYSNEKSHGSEDYSTSDALMNFCRSHRIAVRGHNVLWEDPRFQPSWVGGLPAAAFSRAAYRRINSVMGKYRGKLFQWDVVNENLHFNLVESKLGPSASTSFYQRAHQIDRRTTPFLNDYNTIEDSRDGVSSPANYLKKISQLRQQGYNGPLGIGLEGHFDTTPNLPYIRSAIDMLASARLPIWVTELDVSPRLNQAGFLDQILRELHSHREIQGIIIWSAWSQQGCYRMCLTDNNFRNLPTGDVVDRFRATLAGVANGATDSEGFFEASLFHGEYEAKISHPAGDRVADIQTFNAGPEEEVATIPLKIQL